MTSATKHSATTTGEPAPLAPAGLKGVIVTETAIGDVRGDEGYFHYRGHSAPDLARTTTLEEVWHLLDRGRLPSKAELDRFASETAAARLSLSEMQSLNPGVHADTRPMELLRTLVSAMAPRLGDASWLDLTSDEQRELACRLAANVPVAAAAAWRGTGGATQPSPSPDTSPSRGLAANYLQLVTGQRPADEAVRALERYLMLTIDHGLNASTFACRAVVSTGASFGAALVAGLTSLSGPLHGGAPSLCLDMLEQIEHPSNARRWVRDALANGDKIMGFGHAVYRAADPRSELLRETALELGGPLAELAAEVEPIILEEMERHRPGADLRTNVEFFAAPVLAAVGLPPAMFTPTFAVSRSIGWMTHAMEQAGDNKIIRPSSTYRAA